MDRSTKRLLVSLLSGLVSVVGLNLYHLRFAIQDQIPLFPLTNLIDYEAPVRDWLALAPDLAYAGLAFIAGACLVEVYRAVKSAPKS